MAVHFNPEKFAESTIRCLKDYAEVGFKGSVLDDSLQPAGDQIYDIVMEFPETERILRELPEQRVIVHFEIDDVLDAPLGIGENIAKAIYDEDLQQIFEQEGRRHEFDFDVGIWASDESGGVTARLRAYQTLCNLFVGSQAITKLREATDGGDGQLELIRFTGGKFLTESINDVRVMRVVNCSLVIRVFSRTPNPVVQPTIEDIFQDQTEIIIDGHPIIP